MGVEESLRMSYLPITEEGKSLTETLYTILAKSLMKIVSLSKYLVRCFGEG